MKNDFKPRSLFDRLQSRSQHQNKIQQFFSRKNLTRRLAPTSKRILAGLALVNLVLSSGPAYSVNDAFGISSKSPISWVNPVSGKGFWAEFQETQKGVKKLVGKAVPLDLLVFGRWVRANPIATFQDLRQYSPVLKMSALPIADASYPNKGTIVLSGHDDVVDALNRSTKLTVRNYTKKMEESVGPFMLAYDGSQYNVKEKPWMRQMMPQTDLPKIRKIVRKLIQESIEVQQYVGRSVDGKLFGRLELVNEIARRVPIRLTGEYFGFPGPSLDKMYEWSRATQDDFFHNVKNDAKVRAAAIRAGEEMHTYLGSLIAEKKMKLSSGKEDRADDILSRLVRNSLHETGNDFVDPVSPEDDRIRTNVIGTLVGGVETTQAAITQALNQLLLRPQIFAEAQKAAAANDVDLVAKYVWEALRFQPVNPFVVRYAEEDVTLKSGTIIPKGYHVLIATHSAMFDDSKENYRNPNDFDITRNQNQFFHLGYGSHRCLGDQVALVEVPEVVMALLKLPGLRRASGQDGELDFRRRTAVHALKSDDYETSFPEKFVVEYDVSAEPAKQ